MIVLHKITPVPQDITQDITGAYIVYNLSIYSL